MCKHRCHPRYIRSAFTFPGVVFRLVRLLLLIRQSSLADSNESWLSQITTTKMASQDNQLRPAVTKKQVSYTTPASGTPAHHDFGPEHNSSSINRGSYEKPASRGSEKPFTDDLEAGNQRTTPVRPTLFNRTFTQQFRAAEIGEGEVDFATLSQKEKRKVVKTGMLSYIVDASIKNRKQYYPLSLESD